MSSHGTVGRGSVSSPGVGRSIVSSNDMEGQYEQSGQCREEQFEQ